MQVVHSKVSDKVADVRPACAPSDDISSSISMPADSERAWRSWRWGFGMLSDAEAGDELMSVLRDTMLVASSRDELVLAVMEVVQQSTAGTAAHDAQTRNWQRVIAMFSARPAMRLLAGSSDAVMDGLSGKLSHQPGIRSKGLTWPGYRHSQPVAWVAPTLSLRSSAPALRRNFM